MTIVLLEHAPSRDSLHLPMLTEEIVLGTHNQKKLAELQLLFAKTPVNISSLSEFENAIEVVEDGDSFRSNAEKKASQQAIHLERWVIGEDSGLCVAALKGAPGIYSARFAGDSSTDDDNNELLIESLIGAKDHKANYVSHIALSNPAGEIVLNVEDKCYGQIVDKPRGTSGFGYDPLFEVPEYGLTMAQLGSTVKSIISHRAKAMRKFLKKFLTGNVHS